MHSVKRELTIEDIHQLFRYDPNTGILTWSDKCVKSNKVGSEVGWVGLGYHKVEVYGKTYQVHRIVWAYVYNEWPSKFIDHINGIRDDNRICNLRDVSQRENTCNRQMHRDGKHPGYFYNKWEKRWDARISLGRKRYNLGLFDTEEQAAEAYRTAREEIERGQFPTIRKHKNTYRFHTRIPKNQKSN